MTINELMALDIEFCQATQEGGAKAWASYFSKEGIMVAGSGDNIVGPEAIQKAMAPLLDQAGSSLKWQPSSGSLSEDKSMGYTYGQYIRQVLGEDGKAHEQRGQYTTIWRLQEDGTYKICLDIGN